MADKKNSDKISLKKVQYVLTIIISAVSLILTFILMLSALTRSSGANDMIEQKMITEWDNPILTIVMLAAFFILGYFVIHLGRYRVNSLFGFTIAFHLLAGGALILFSRSAPGGDASSVFVMAEWLSEGNLDFFGVSDSYLSYYPQQIGLTVFLSFFMKIIKLVPYSFAMHHAIKIFYVIFNCISVVFGYLAVKEIWDDESVTSAFLYISVFNLPFIMYSSFIYGEVPSFCAMTVAAYFIARLQKKNGAAVINILATVTALTLSVFVRKNSLIYVIAVLIVLVLIFFGNRRKEFLITAAAVLIMCILILPLTIKYYEVKTGREADDGVTMYSYLAMGMQDDSSRGPGWYNGFNFNTYRDTGMDAKETNWISSEAIKERLEFFKNNPGEFISFYRGKFETQWCDPTLAVCQATYEDFDGRTEFMQSVYEGGLNKVFVAICNMLQNAVYIGAFIWSFLNFKKIIFSKNKEISPVAYLGMITVIGGFIFHMIWEANSRYIFPYAMMLIPYAAFGYGKLADFDFGKD